LPPPQNPRNPASPTANAAGREHPTSAPGGGVTVWTRQEDRDGPIQSL